MFFWSSLAFSMIQRMLGFHYRFLLFPVLLSRSSLFICFVYSSLYQFISTS